jgi:protoporphyrin/coproporphyrin ferrochelatase
MTAGKEQALLVIAHGTVDDLDDLPAFLALIRRGHAPPPELVAEVRRRYEAIGGRSPLNDICQEVTRKLGERLGLRAEFAARLWKPKAEVALGDLAASGASQVVVVPLAQHSAPLYVDAARRAAAVRTEAGEAPLEIFGPANWGREPKLTATFAASLSRALVAIPEAARAKACVLFTAHSLPLAVIRGGDPYEGEVRASAAAVAEVVGASMPRHEVIFQSQGMGGGEWLGPDVRSTLERLAGEGVKHVVFAPIGFLADHVEVLYDLDIEARAWTVERGMEYSRIESLNASDPLIDALCAVVRSVQT